MQVEDGRPFCPSCRAPQLQVRISASHPEGLPEPFHSDGTTLTDLGVGPSHSGLPNRGIAVSAALKAGIVGVLLGIIPLIGSVLIGGLTVFFYYRSGGSPRLNAHSGSQLGACGGAVAFVISGLFTVIDIFVFHAQKESEEAMLRLMASIGADTASPGIQAGIHALFTPWGMTMSFLFGLIITVALAAIGGAIGASFFSPRTTL
jgi:hypothetical protein